jgi:hypothetical protein
MMKFLKHCLSGYKLVFIFIFLAGSFTPSITYGQSSEDPVTATVRISVCGDGVAEGGEECDNRDLKGKKCADVGYKPGNLNCSAACEFDVSKCGDPLPFHTYGNANFNTYTAVPDVSVLKTMRMKYK